MFVELQVEHTDKEKWAKAQLILETKTVNDKGKGFCLGASILLLLLWLYWVFVAAQAFL